MSTSIKFNDKEVKNPVLRIVVAGFVIICGIVLVVIFGFSLLFVTLGLLGLGFVLTVPLHFILRFCGRRGFYVREGNNYTWTTEGAFRRR